MPVLVLTFRGPGRDGLRGSGPQGARQEAARFSTSTGMCCRKTPRSPCTRRAASGATDGVCFLWVTLSFAQAKKSDSLAAASETREQRQGLKRGIPACAGMTEHGVAGMKQIPRLQLGMTQDGSNWPDPMICRDKKWGYFRLQATALDSSHASKKQRAGVQQPNGWSAGSTEHGMADASQTKNASRGEPAGIRIGNRGAYSRCATPARSSSSSARVLSMRARLKSSTGRPSTRVYSPLAQVTGTPYITPSGMP